MAQPWAKWFYESPAWKHARKAYADTQHGLCERCKAKGIDYKVGKFPLVANGKSLIINGGEGLVKIIADAKYEEVLGMHIIGPRATDLIAEGALALRLEATVDELISTIHSHPTVSESVRECALNVQKRAIHIKN